MSSRTTMLTDLASLDIVVEESRAAELKSLSKGWPSWCLTARQTCDLELVMNGGFAPLRGFLGRGDYERVCREGRLADGTLWPIPIVLDVSEEAASRLDGSPMLALRDAEGVMLAALHVSDVWKPDLAAEAELVYGTADAAHPGVAYLNRDVHPYYVGGRIESLELPRHYDFPHLRLTPAQLKRRFTEAGWGRVVAFQTRNPMHRAHVELTLRAMNEADANLLIHPVVGMTKPGDVDHYTRVRCYQAVLNYYPCDKAMLSLLPLAMRMAGPREAVLHAIIRKNHGCTHFIVGRDHAGPGADPSGKPFYGPYEAQDALRACEAELGIKLAPFEMMVYVEEEDKYLPASEVPQGRTARSLSGTELRQRLDKAQEIPAWFSYPNVVRELRRAYPSRHKRGFVVFLTGLPSAGKSTLANVLVSRLLEAGGRSVTLLDGDLVRKHLSSELGFSREHRDLNIRRIGFVAAEVAKGGGVAVCAPIAPYDGVRKDVRRMTEEAGAGFFLVHVATPLEVCEQRDRKGLYAKARAGIVKEFTGISDPYEEPSDAEIVLDTTASTPEDGVRRILSLLEKEGYVSGAE